MFTSAIIKSTLIGAVIIASAIFFPADARATSIVAKVTLSDEFSISETGLSVFPGAKRLQNPSESEINGANIDFAIGKYGLKVTTVKLLSDASPADIATFYKQDLQRHGELLDCSKPVAQIDEERRHEGDTTAVQENKLTCDTRAPKSRSRQHEGSETRTSENGVDRFHFRVGDKFQQHIVTIRPRQHSVGETEITLVHVNLRLPTWMTEKKNRTYISFEP